MKKFLLLVAITVASACGPAPSVHVVDGDTIKIEGQTYRIVGLDTPELRGKCEREIALARRAKARLESIVSRGAAIETLAGRDKYGRGLVRVRERASGVDVADILVREGLARPYHGRGQREGWC